MLVVCYYISQLLRQILICQMGMIFIVIDVIHVEEKTWKFNVIGGNLVFRREKQSSPINMKNSKDSLRNV
jgi:hypothetical protein